MAHKQTGIIVKYDSGRHFGFIRIPRVGNDIFFHQADIISGDRHLTLGTKVKFNSVTTEKGPKAVSIEIQRLPINPYIFFSLAFTFLVLAIFLAFSVSTDLNWCLSMLISLNCSAFAICGYDKAISATSAMRLPELVLFVTAAVGGSIGIILGMRLFRHKTQKPSFQLVLGMIVVAQIALVRLLQSQFGLLMLK